MPPNSTPDPAPVDWPGLVIQLGHDLRSIRFNLAGNAGVENVKGEEALRYNATNAVGVIDYALSRIAEARKAGGK